MDRIDEGKPVAGEANADVLSSETWASSLSSLSTPLLNSKLSSLRTQSQTLSSNLTARLASSPSGQSLLHIGPSLSTLPPDLQMLMDSLKPMLNDVHEYQQMNQNELIRIVTAGKLIQREVRRAKVAKDCAGLLKDFGAVEHLLSEINNISDDKDIELYQMASLERAAHTALMLTQSLQASSNQITETLHSGPKNEGNTILSMDTPLPQDTERAQFIMKLAPRIRALEKKVNESINFHLERALKNRMDAVDSVDAKAKVSPSTNELLILGHIFRSFALMGRGMDAEAIFARVAIMPIVRKQVSIGKLDEGGSRGECVGLNALLQEIVSGIQLIWSEVLHMVEGMFSFDDIDANGTDDEKNPLIEIDLITAGVWVPIVTALMTDPAIKSAIFSPGIATIFQRNYRTMEAFLSNLTSSLLSPSNEIQNLNQSMESMSFGDALDEDCKALIALYYQPEVDQAVIKAVQRRIYTHSLTVDYSKKWNLPIYYQLRFGEVCSRLEEAIQGVIRDGWEADVFTGDEVLKKTLSEKYVFETPFFMEVFDILTWMWSDEVLLKPLTHRFLRGTIQLIGRLISFINEGLEGKILFGVSEEEELPSENGDVAPTTRRMMINSSYKWCDRIQDVATVSWELTVLSNYIITEHIQNIAARVCPSNISDTNLGTSFETSELISEIMTDASNEITPAINNIWNGIVVKIMINKCSTPLSAVKGVAATYRMTNRPPPTQPSPFVNTILRPLKEFDAKFSSRTPSHIGSLWKRNIITNVSEKYSKSVAELLETVQKTEEALKNRKTRRTMAGGMSDGEKVRLQLYLDQKAYVESVQDCDIDPSTVDGINDLISLTKSAEELYTN